MASDAAAVMKEALAGLNAGIKKVTAPDGPFPLVEEEVEHWGTKQRYLSWQRGAQYPNSIVHLTLPDMYADACTRYCNLEAVVYQHSRMTFSELGASAAALARDLASTYGIQRDVCVAIAGRNHHEWIISFMAVSGHLSATALTVNSFWINEELRYGLEDSESRLLLADPFILQRAPFLKEMGVRAICMQPGDSPPAGVRTFAEALASGKQLGALNPRGIAQDDRALLMYTSGTTNKPKGVVMTHRGVMSAVNCLRCLKYSPEVTPVTQATYLLGSPLFHVTATHVALLPSMALGSKLVTMYKWDATEALKLIERERIQTIVGVPTMTYEIANHPDLARYDTSSLLTVGGGGAAFAAPMIKKVNDKLKSAKAGTGYGLTETNAASVFMPGALFPLKPLSCGIPLMNVECCILSDAGTKQPTDEIGEICLRGAGVMREYWKKPDKTSEVFHIDAEGRLWFRTGDIGSLDQDGFLYIVDRAKDIIIRGGENISCAEVEGALYDHPSILEVAAIGLPHPNLGETVAVAVILKPGERPPTVEDLKSHAKARLAPFKVPADIFIWGEATLPRGATGKIQKREIRERLKQPQSKL
mmetsp:Transcript_36779/g.84698  ORF Transcript_36779/g.84698 Transcript_36779/m.84698 type:complete len:589 (-) Transcript_36779:24-1790(-)